MVKIVNEGIKWLGRGCMAIFVLIGWDKLGKACDTATKENRYVGGQAIRKAADAINTEENCKFVANIAMQAINSGISEALRDENQKQNDNGLDKKETNQRSCSPNQVGSNAIN